MIEVIKQDKTSGESQPVADGLKEGLLETEMMDERGSLKEGLPAKRFRLQVRDTGASSGESQPVEGGLKEGLDRHGDAG